MNYKNLVVAKYRKNAFIKKLPPKATILDVGCGNNSPTRVKGIRKDVYYVGIDISDYNNTKVDINSADEYITCDPENFAERISELGQRFDAVISSHNLEHCYQPQKVISSICSVLKPQGRLYLAFPSEESVNLPSREGTLNFYDDPTHCWLPLWDEVISILEHENMKIVFSKNRYRPFIPVVLGLILEPFSRFMKKLYFTSCTWALYGFESVIWAQKKETLKKGE